MDFRYTPEQERFRDEIRGFLAANVSDALRLEIATSGHSPGPLGKAFLRLLGERGWLGVGWPREYGGQGRSMIEQTIFYHELDLQDIHYTFSEYVRRARFVVLGADDPGANKLPSPVTA